MMGWLLKGVDIPKGPCLFRVTMNSANVLLMVHVLAKKSNAAYQRLEYQFVTSQEVGLRGK
jgi:hypothetical protein